MNYLVIDGEWTIRNWKKGQGGDPFDPQNKLCLVGTKIHQEGKPSLKDSENEWDCSENFKIEYDAEPYGEALSRIQSLIEAVDTLVLFNAKRDLHWLRRYGLRFSHRRIWDVQYAHFIEQGQSSQYPSLNDVCQRYGHPEKLDVIQLNYWDKGIDTDEVPLDELLVYLDMDVVITESCFLSQMAGLSDKHQRLTLLGGKDLLILQEMEWNGIIYDQNKSLEMAEETREEISQLDDLLVSLTDLGFALNWNSDEQVSAVLYGGKIEHKFRVEDGIYKTGKKAGLPKYRWDSQIHDFPRLVNPLKGSELDDSKQGKVWSVAEPVLQQLKAYGKAKRIIETLLKRAKLEKLVSSYLEGIPKLCSSMGWGTTIHGTLNQCVARTGRLSSSKPNLQNNDKKVEKLFRSRYE